jgi:hypothetical protein
MARSPLRSSIIIPLVCAQIGFIKVVVEPLYAAVVALAVGTPVAARLGAPLAQLRDNLDFWKLEALPQQLPNTTRPRRGSARF